MPYTDQEIRDYVTGHGYVRSDGGLKDEASGWAIARDASQYGVTDTQLDGAMKPLGWNPGDTRGWLDQRGATGMLKSNTGGSVIGPPPRKRPPDPDPVPAQPAAFAGANVPSWASNPTPGAVKGALTSLAGKAKGPASFNVSDSMLTSNQLMKLLSADSPYITRARSRAAEYSNARGLLNSSIGAGAGEAAAIDAALPIAQGDAMAHFEGGMANFDAQNQFARDENQFFREGALSALGHGFNLHRDVLGYQFESGEKAADRALTASEGRANRAMDWDLADLRETGEDWRLGRTLDSDERMRREGWANDRSENALDRASRSDENRIQREFDAGENQTDRDWKSDQNQLQRDWQTGENQTDRDIRSSERIDDDLSTIEANYSRDLANLENNTNLTPEERASAINRLGDFYETHILPHWASRAGIDVADRWPDGFGVRVEVGGGNGEIGVGDDPTDGGSNTTIGIG